MYTSSRKPTLRSGILLLILGTICLVFGTFNHIEHCKVEKACTEKTTGTVTEVQTYQSSKKYGHRKKEYKAIVDYTIPDSDKHYSLTTEHSTKTFTQGEQVTVMYDPNDAHNAYSPEGFRDTGLYVMLSSLFFGGLGLLFTIVSIRDKNRL